jgi:hypothetical protein
MVAGLPIPRLSRLVSAVLPSASPLSSRDTDRLEQTRETISSLKDALEMLKKGVRTDSEDAVQLLHLADGGPSGSPAFAPTITHAQAQVVKALFAVLNDPSASRCGLMRVQLREGSWAWSCSGSLYSQRLGA